MADNAAPDALQRPGFGERLAGAVVAGRWLIIAGWVAATVACLAFLPAKAAGDGGLEGLLSGETPAVETERRSVEIFGFPLIGRTVVVQRDESGMSPYAQARTVIRATAVSRGEAENVGPILGALPMTNTLGLFPGSRETDTTSLTYLLFEPDASFGARTRAAERYADRFFTERDHVVGVTGSAPARTTQGRIIRESLPAVEAFTLLAIVAIVGLAFRSVVAPLLALLTAGVSYVITLRLAAYASERFDLATPDELEPVVVALLLGVVTDYVIFFCSSLRGQPPLPHGDQPGRAVAATTRAAIARSTPIVAVAGLAVAAGTATLIAAESPFFRALGPALAFTVLVALLVAITLVPAILAVLGDRVFWPSTRQPRAASLPRWRRVMRVTTPRWPRRVITRVTSSRRAAAAVLATGLAGMALASGLALRLDLGVSFVGALPPDAPVRAAALSAQSGFADGILSPTVLLVEGAGVPEDRADLRRFGSRVAALPGVAGVLGPGSQPTAVERRALTSREHDAARFLVVLDSDPLGARAVQTVDRLQRDLNELRLDSGLRGATVSVAGDSATASYIVAQTEDDLLRIAITALVANLLMLLLFLRAVVASVCLLATTVLSLGATLGITSWVFDQVAPEQGLTFYVPFAAAVLLLAFGSDYNIFTVGHVWEDAPGRTLREAIRAALPPAVSAVSTAGLALGASFGLLSLVPLASFRQLAFAVAFGLTIEILVVRLLVVPAMLSLLGTRAAWPSKRFGRSPTAPAPPA